MTLRRRLFMASAPAPGDIFGDGSNLFTLDIADGTLGSKEGGWTIRGYENRGVRRDGVIVFSTNVPYPGWGYSIALSDNQDDAEASIDFPSGITDADIKAYSCWIYVVQHDNDDNIVLGINLKRQNNGNMFVYAVNPATNDTFSALSTGTWHHMAVVDEGTTMRTYLNGSSLGTHSIGTGQIYWDTQAFGTDGTAQERRLMTIADADASNEIFITGARFFNRALSASEVTTLYNENPS